MGKPTAPMQTFAHGAAVTHVLQVQEHVLAVAGVDGNITLWDPRRAAYPIRTIALGDGCAQPPSTSSCTSFARLPWRVRVLQT